MSWIKVNIIIILLFIFHLVGGVALSINSAKSIFLALTPFNLLLTFGLLIFGNWDLEFLGILTLLEILGIPRTLMWFGCGKS